MRSSCLSIFACFSAVLITEDASEDARFAGNPYVAGAPFIKFYAGAPLVGKSA
jgi:GAF domain-containing protein